VLKPSVASVFIDVALLLLASYFVLFLNLGRGAIRQWDESSLAVNALEMSRRGEVIVKYLDGEPDLVNTKPPLLIWIIAGLMRLLGPNELALRLPSALSALFTVLVVSCFSATVSGHRLAALLTGLVLLTAIGFTGEHVARHGDYDAMLVLWVTVYALAYFKYLHEVEGGPRHRHLAWATGGLVLAVMTKGVAGLLVLPGLMLYTAWRRQLGRVLATPAVWLAAVAATTAIVGYYGLREALGPGYWQAVVRNELTGRLMEVVPGGTERGSLYYLDDMVLYRFVPWIYVLPLSWVIAWRSEERAVRHFGAFSLIYVCCYLAIISASKSKFRWYDAPVYPIAAAIIGIAVAAILELLWIYVSPFLRSRIKSGRALVLGKGVLAGVMVAALCGYPYVRNAYHEVYEAGIPFRDNDKAVTDAAQAYKAYYRELAAADLDLGTKPLTVVNGHRYNLPLLFYTEVAELRGRYSLRVEWRQPSDVTFTDGDILISCDVPIGAKIRERYIVTTVHRSASCETLVVERGRAGAEERPDRMWMGATRAGACRHGSQPGFVVSPDRRQGRGAVVHYEPVRDGSRWSSGRG
jgi:4-amino-4-deoxy-L-arabinose transferase-like glycosyltransferase